MKVAKQRKKCIMDVQPGLSKIQTLVYQNGKCANHHFGGLNGLAKKVFDIQK